MRLRECDGGTRLKLYTFVGGVNVQECDNNNSEEDQTSKDEATDCHKDFGKKLLVFLIRRKRSIGWERRDIILKLQTKE